VPKSRNADMHMELEPNRVDNEIRIEFTMKHI
jgi:hypothetical protein